MLYFLKALDLDDFTGGFCNQGLFFSYKLKSFNLYKNKLNEFILGRYPLIKAAISGLGSVPFQATTNIPATTAPRTNVPVTTAGQTNAPVTTAPRTNAPVTTAPRTNAPVTTAGQTNGPITTVGPTSQTCYRGDGYCKCFCNCMISYDFE